MQIQAVGELFTVTRLVPVAKSPNDCLACNESRSLYRCLVLTFSPFPVSAQTQAYMQAGVGLTFVDSSAGFTDVVHCSAEQSEQ